MKIINLLMLILTLSLSCLSYGQDFTPVSERTPQVKSELEKKVNLFASDITKEDLLKIEELDLTPGTDKWSEKGIVKPIKKLKPGDLDGLDNLSHLYLSSNHLTELPEGIFKGVPNLVLLNLGWNKIKTLPEGIFKNLSNLKVLSISGNPLIELPEGIFAGLENLTRLDMQDNQLIKLPEGIFKGVPNLKRLFLTNNEFKNTKSIPKNVFRPLTQLEDLYIHDSKLTTLPDGVFGDFLKNLEELSLNSNELTKLPYDMFDNLPRLRELDLTNNKNKNLLPIMTGHLKKTKPNLKCQKEFKP